VAAPAAEYQHPVDEGIGGLEIVLVRGSALAAVQGFVAMDIEEPIDPLLARIPLDWPWSFTALPPDERSWRGRVFLAVWIWSGSAPFAWSVALNRDAAIAADNRRFVEELGDAAIFEALNAR
jgi:hypothetical protein